MDFYTTTDEEKVEIVKAWLKKNCWYLLLLVALIYFSFFGYQYWCAAQIKSNQKAAGYFEKALMFYENEDKTAVFAELENLTKEFPRHTYTAMANFIAAKMDIENAPQYFNFVIKNTNGEDLTEIAKIRLARWTANKGSQKEALAILDTVKGDLYKAQAYAVRGDILFDSSPREAKNNYLMALTLGRSGSGDRYSVINMKIQRLNVILQEPEEISNNKY